MITTSAELATAWPTRRTEKATAARDSSPAAQPLAVAEEQEEDVVGADPEQHDDQQRGERGVDLEAERVGEQRDQRGREQEHEPDRRDRQDSGDGAAEDAADEEQDQHEGGGEGDRLGAAERLLRVDDARGVAGEAGLEAAAGEQARCLVA